jgi:demethylmenaquinone methyltransferase/2-methoxy-6-polyprenyl-1,4-benzoquinol methylase
MTGMGECPKHILKQRDEGSTLIALDISSEMIRRAYINKAKYPKINIKILKENVFSHSIPNERADLVASGFGLKTCNTTQLLSLAQEINRILNPGGKCSFLDVSVPQNSSIRPFYLFYLKKIIPIIGKLFLGNPETYKMLGIYTDEFQKFNFEVENLDYFFGCTTGIKGRNKKKQSFS